MHGIQTLLNWQSERLKSLYEKDHVRHFRAVTTAWILISLICLFVFVTALLFVFEHMKNGVNASAIITTTVAISGLLHGVCYKLLLSGKLDTARFMFMTLAYGSVISTICMTGGFLQSNITPCFIIINIISFCIYGGRISLILALVTPIAVIAMIWASNVFNLTYPNISHSDLPLSNQYLVGTVLYVLIITGLFHQDRSNIQFLKTAVSSIKKNRNLAATDYLTDLPNRRHFIQSVETLKHQHNSVDAIACLACIDVDNFKHINDSYGHVIGDKVLRRIASALKSLNTETLITARVGGDEFAIFSLLRAERDSHDLADKLETSLPAFIDTPKGRVNISCSIGVYSTPTSDFQFSGSAPYVDYALYKAKSNPHSNLHVFTHENKIAIEKEKTIDAVIKERFESKNIQNHYQLMLASGSQTSIVEALLRVHDNDGNLISPPICMEAIERQGLTAQFTVWQLESAILDVMSVSGSLQLAFNLSPLQVKLPHLAATISGILSRTQFNPNRLIIEISELTAYSDLVITTLGQLKDLGVKLAIDDFGIGQTSFQVFNKVNIDILKADRSLLNSGPKYTLNRFILQQVSDYCKTFDVRSVCEGIETDHMLDEMRDFGFDYFQGYKISRPSNLVEQMKVLNNGLGTSTRLQSHSAA